MKLIIISYVCLILTILTTSTNVTRWELSKENTIKKVLENSTIELDCLAQPPINSSDLISWYRHGKLIRYQFKGRFYRASTSMVRITNVTAEDQGSYRCERIINGFEHNVADGFLDVLIPPKYVRLSLTKSTQAMRYVENDKVELECCTNGDANPEPEFTWFHYHNIVNHMESLSYRNMNQKCSRTIVKLSRKANGIPFRCHVSNEAVKEPLRSNLQLNVEYKPAQVQIILNNQTKINESAVWLFENSQIDLTCQALASPSNVAYQWFFNDKIISRDQTLQLKNLSKVLIGNYSCAVENKHGQTFSEVKSLQITYLNLSALNKSNETNPILINTSENQTVELACKVNSSNVTSSIIWSKLKQDNTRINLNAHQNMSQISKLTINKITSKDAGYYTCSINTNLTDSQGVSINIQQERTFYLNFQYKPQITLFKSVYYADINETLKFICEADSSPKVSNISWYLNDKLIQLNKVPANSDIESPYSVTSTLSVVVRSKADFGQYSCHASNTIGTSVRTISLNKTKMPRVPKYFSAQNITSNSAILTWTSSSFAEPTNFILNVNDLKNISISGQSLAFKVNNLNANETYAVKILEQNKEGASEFTEPIKFRTVFESIPITLPSLGPIDLDIQEFGICLDQSQFNNKTQFLKVKAFEHETEYKIQPFHSENGKYCVQYSELTNLTANHETDSLTLEVCDVEQSMICSNKVNVQLRDSKENKTIVFHIILIILGTAFSVTIIILFSMQRKRNNKAIEDIMYWDPKVDSIQFIDLSSNSTKQPVTYVSDRYDKNPVLTTSHYINTKF